jgi:hypothetical protein
VTIAVIATLLVLRLLWWVGRGSHTSTDRSPPLKPTRSEPSMQR